MAIILSSICIAASILLFGWAYAQYRQPNLPAWFGSDLTVQIVCVAIVALMAFGCSFLVAAMNAMSSLASAPVQDLVGLALIAASLVAARQLVMRGRRVAASG